ncbi:hypothetical protein JCM10213v2_008515, partial [Rhodosporidiobolus nylandii]
SMCLPLVPHTPESREFSILHFGTEEGQGDSALNVGRWEMYEARMGVVGRAKEWVGAALWGR